MKDIISDKRMNHNKQSIFISRLHQAIEAKEANSNIRTSHDQDFISRNIISSSLTTSNTEKKDYFNHLKEKRE